MLGKRHREDDTPLSPPGSPPVKPLTRANLAALQKTMVGRGNRNRTRSDNVSGTTRLSNNSASSSVTDAVLERWAFHANRNLPQPPGLQELISLVTIPRDGAITPNSRAITAMHQETQKLFEFDAIDALATYLGYLGEIHAGGEKNICRGMNHQWRDDAMPAPPMIINDLGVPETAQRIIGIPSSPKPDIIYGYSDTSFNRDDLNTLRDLPRDHQLREEGPWFPFCIYEWKSGRSASEWKALCQARRDGPVAINASWNLFKTAHFTDIPAEHTAVFTVCVTSNIVQININWRRVGSDGELSWECDEIESGFIRKAHEMFRIRSVLLNILEWARGPRLALFTKALRKSREQPASGSAACSAGPSVPVQVPQYVVSLTALSQPD